jgi:hypothetical protein
MLPLLTKPSGFAKGRLWAAFLLPVLVGSLAIAQPIETVSTNTSTVTTNGSMTTTVKSPPPSAISPQIGGNASSDLCTVGVAGAVQTQILGISAGTTFTEENCIRLKNAKTLYDMGMKVAAVSVMCKDQNVFEAMMHAGTPCPYDGMIGPAAKAAWQANPKPAEVKDEKSSSFFNTGYILGILGLLLLF